MRAVRYEQFGGPLDVVDLEPPVCAPDGVVVRVEATGLCRSDWHGWMGHDADVVLPHVPGHEFAGVVAEVGPEVTRWRVGDRVTAPFVCACGTCPTCRRGDLQVCERQQQPGFTHPGSFAEFVAVPVADLNVIALPDGLDAVAAAALGCRFATAYRAVVAHARPAPGDWLAVHGCGGVGLAAVMIAVAGGARVIAVDPSAAARERALALGAEQALPDATAVAELTDGGTAASIDAIGGADSLLASVRSLRRRGRHVQVGLLGGDHVVAAEVIGLAVSRELELLGSHGMSALDYPAMLARIVTGELDPARLVAHRVGLAEGAAALARLGDATVDGITVIQPSRA
ncbi:MAG: alcohol dehydrogenase catalytic domain-containing protein [Jatrophihabitans sp.]|uniref:alcohol dehydrogenase catalytic domain-containing protein n=1 Tax=Jatrophihabitans sp. TaxID=1932789 RepID=UPI003F803052